MKKLINIDEDYNQIFTKNVEKKLASTLEKITKTREELLEEQKLSRNEAHFAQFWCGSDMY